MGDQAAVLAEFAELFRAEQPDDDFTQRLASLLEGKPQPHPVVELGSGTGYRTLQVAQMLPEADIIAVERSATMRSVLNSRLAADAGARRHLTVVADDAFEARLPPLWSTVIAFHFVCQLSPRLRKQFWAMLAEHLAPGGIAVLDTCYGPRTANGTPRKLLREMTAGRNTYRWWVESQPSGPAALDTTNTYQTLRAGEVVAEASARHIQHVVTEEELFQEITRTGLQHRIANGFLVVAR